MTSSDCGLNVFTHPDVHSHHQHCTARNDMRCTSIYSLRQRTTDNILKLVSEDGMILTQVAYCSYSLVAHLQIDVFVLFIKSIIFSLGMNNDQLGQQKKQVDHEFRYRGVIEI